MNYQVSKPASDFFEILRLTPDAGHGIWDMGHWERCETIIHLGNGTTGQRYSFLHISFVYLSSSFAFLIYQA